MTDEQISNFNKRSFPYYLFLKGKNIHLRKGLLDNLTEKPNNSEPSINLWNVPAETIFIMQNELLNSLFIDNNILYINTNDR